MKTAIMVMILLLVLGVFIQFVYSGYFFYRARGLSKKIYTVKDLKLGNPKNPPYRLFIDGDSVAAGFGSSSLETSVAGRLANELAKKYYLNFSNVSTNGIRMRDMLNRPLPIEKQDLIILIISSNDLFKFSSLGEFEKDTQRVLNRYSLLTNKLIIVGPGRVFDTAAIPFPVRVIYKYRAGKYAQVISDEVKNFNNTVHVNPINPPSNLPDYGQTLSEDKFHPNDSGHLFWFDLIKPYLP